jgi:tetratricopeptide (TPR) repeat protein
LKKKSKSRGESKSTGLVLDWLKLTISVFLQQRKYEDAITLLKLSQLMYKSDSDLIKMLAYCYLELGEYELSVESCQDYLKLVQLNRENRAILLILSRSLNKQKKYDKSITAYKKYLAITE